MHDFILALVLGPRALYAAATYQSTMQPDSPVSRPQPIMLKILPIMLLSGAQKILPFMLNVMPMTTAIIPQFIHNIIFSE